MRQAVIPGKIFLALFLILASALPACAVLTNGLALVPPMGFNSWYQYGASVNESLIESIADEMATNGLLAAGYQYINLDDSWMGYRDTNGVMVANTNRFPDGIQFLANYVHARGFKFGLYTTGSSNTCGGYPGSAGHEEQDADTYASWGVDYLKYELCSLSSYEAIPHAQIYDVRMSQALLHCGRPIVFSCSIGTFENWIPNYINLWRGTGDIFSSWDTILSHIAYVSQTPSAAGPGGWNDADVLEVGNGAFNQNESQAIFSMWCILTGPLLTMNSGSTATNILCNGDAIAVDQDPAGIQGICVASNAQVQVWSKPLGGSNSTTVAVVLFNPGTNSGCITANWTDLGLPPGVATVWDIWAQAYAGNATNSYTATIPGHSVQFLRIVSGATLPLPPVGTNYLSNLKVLSNYTNAAPVQLDLSAAAAPITLRGTNYPKGLGMTAYSRDDYFLGGAATDFQSEIGLDDAAGSQASVIFRVYADGAMIYDSGTLTTAAPVQTIDLNVTGVTRLTLEVTNALANAANDYADWAEARIIVPPQPTDLLASTAGGAINLSWDAPPGATGYEVLRSTNSGGPYSPISASPTNAYADATALPDVVYYYVVSATTTNGQTTNSAPISIELTPYWTNLATGAAQNWNAGGNWSNTAAFPNAVGRVAIINANISSNQTINLNQDLTVGSLSIGSSSGSAAYTIAPNGGTLALNNTPAAPTLTQLSSSAGDTISAPVAFTGNLLIGNNSTNPFTLSGAVSGDSLRQTGTGVIVFNGSNSFSGPITNTQGVLMVGNAGALSGCSIISIASGALLDTSALDGAGLVLSNGQTLSGSGAVNGNLTIGGGATLAPDGLVSILTFSNSLTFDPGATCRLQVSKNPVTNNLVVVLGTLTYGGTLTVTNISATPLAAGDSFTLFSGSNYLGAFANIVPSTPGPGLLWDVSGLAGSGTLTVVTTGSFTIGLSKISGSNLVFSLSGGGPNAAFYVLATTNLSLPLAQWTRVATNMFDGSGYATFTNALSPTVPFLFYCVQSQ